MKSTRKSPNSRPLRRAVGAVRISKNRADETSTATQEERIRAYCSAQGLDVVEVVSDVGRSAYKESRSSRPGLRRARALIRTGAADVLVCWKIDRVARNTRDLLELIHEVEADGGAFASVTEQFDTSTAFGKAVVTIIGALAELESAQKSERSTTWHEARLANGATPTGWTPYGYRRERNQLLVDEAEAPVLKDAAAAVLAGESLRSLVARLNAEHPRSDGRPFSARTLRIILTNPTVAALRRDGDDLVTSDAWEPILDRETFERVGQVLADPERRTSPGNARRWLLAGFLTCGADGCGGVMGSRPSIRGPRYACRRCGMSIGAADTDTIVEDSVLDNLDLDAWRRLQRRGVPVDTSALEAELTALAARRVDPDPRQRLRPEEWEVLRAGIVAQLQAATAEPLPLPRVDDPRKEWPDLGVEARRLIIAAFVDRAVVAPGGRGVNQFDATRVQVTPRRL